MSGIAVDDDLAIAQDDHAIDAFGGQLHIVRGQ